RRVSRGALVPRSVGPAIIGKAPGRPERTLETDRSERVTAEDPFSSCPATGGAAAVRACPARAAASSPPCESGRAAASRLPLVWELASRPRIAAALPPLPCALWPNDAR